MYSIKQIDEAMRTYLRCLDVDGTRQTLEDLIAQGEVEIVSIRDGEFIFRRMADDEEAPGEAF